ncbi:MAG: TPM domain-containing protein [Nannocystaceae bacterium]
MTGPLQRAERLALQAAIADAERGHRGEIQVHLEPRYPGDGARSRAAELFELHGLDETRDGTGVLVYVAELDRRVAVFAGPGVFGARTPAQWTDVCARIAAGYRDGDRLRGLTDGLRVLAEVLREAAPGEDDAGDELANEVHAS